MQNCVLWVVLSEERVFKEGQGQQKKFNAQVDQDSLGHIRQTRSDIRAVRMLMKEFQFFLSPVLGRRNIECCPTDKN